MESRLFGQDFENASYLDNPGYTISVLDQSGNNGDEERVGFWKSIVPIEF